MPGFAITALMMSHFRSHRRTNLAFDGRPVAIFGANGAGKTNILEAISLLSPGRGLRRATPAEFARRPEMLGWKIKAEIGSHQIETFAEAAGPRSVLIDGKGTTQVDLGRVTRILWLVPAMDRLWLEGAEGRRRFLDRMVLSFVPAHADAVLA
ncbi:MAG: AAA family ATPase, partial [Paracoccaceae bacterium]